MAASPASSMPLPLPPPMPAPPLTSRSQRPGSSSARRRIVPRHTVAGAVPASGRAGARVTRPTSARPAPSSTGVTVESRLATLLNNAATTPSHLLRLRLNQSLAPSVTPLGVTSLAGPSQLEAALEAVRAKLQLLDDERAGAAERHELSVQQNSLELDQLTRENGELRQQTAAQLANLQARRRAAALQHSAHIRSITPLAWAGSVRALAATGQSYKRDSLFATAPSGTPPASVRRRPSSARPNSALTLYSPPPVVDVSSTVANSPPVVLIAASIVPAMSLQLRKAYDSLRHTTDLKQKHHDALVSELRMMIVKVKRPPSPSVGLTEQKEERALATTVRTFNPQLLTMNELHSRLQKLASSHNDLLDEERLQMDTLHALQKDNDAFPGTIQQLERLLHAREADLENLARLFSHARMIAQSTRGEQATLSSRLSHETHERAQHLREIQGDATDRTPSPALSRTPSSSPLSDGPFLALLDGTPADDASLSTALVLATTAPDPNEAFLATLTTQQQSLCQVFINLEARLSEESSLSSPPPPSILDASYAQQLVEWQAATPTDAPIPAVVDVSLLVSSAIAQLESEGKSRELLAQRETRITELCEELDVARKMLEEAQNAPPLSSCDAETESPPREHEKEQQGTQEHARRLNESIEEQTVATELITRQAADADQLLADFRARLRQLQDRVDAAIHAPASQLTSVFLTQPPVESSPSSSEGLPITAEEDAALLACLASFQTRLDELVATIPASDLPHAMHAPAAPQFGAMSCA